MSITVTGASGEGSASLGGLVVPTDIDVHLTSLGSAHRFVGSTVYRVQHVGWFALCYDNDADSLPDVVWWQFVNFNRQDIPVPAFGFGVHRFIWNLEPGCVATFLVSF